MNTKASVAYGWGVLILAGGGSYYFAKRSINADRQERADAEGRRRAAQHRLQYGTPDAAPGVRNGGASPGVEAHEGEVAPAAVKEGLDEKYESKRPFRSPKGDRFS